jgi:hypothetical protein
MTLRMSVLLAVGLYAAAPVVAQELVIVLEGSKEYHRPACERIQGRSDVLAMQRGQAESRGFKAHAQCESARVPPPPPEVIVTVDEGAKYYHREKCAKIGKSPRKLSLDEAAKKHWPCPACKPPIRPRKKPGLSSAPTP